MFGPGLRASFRGPYAIYYLVAARELVVVRIIHGARDITALAERGAFAETEHFTTQPSEGVSTPKPRRRR